MNKAYVSYYVSHYHPGVLFAFFVIAIIFSLVLRHPAFVAASLLSSVSFFMLLKGREAYSFLGAMAVLMVVLSLINPLLNTQGDTVLFVLFGSRNFTLESLLYGVTTACTFTAMMMWFASYNALMTSDKFTYLFGGISPALSLLFTMVLRLVPHYRIKIEEIAGARACIGKGLQSEEFGEKIAQGASVLSLLTSWAFDNAAVTAESLNSRGYGTGKRTCYGDYRFKRADGVFVVLEFIGTVSALVASFGSVAQISFFPCITVSPFTGLSACVLLGYTALIGAPFVISIGELISWRSSLSKI